MQVVRLCSIRSWLVPAFLSCSLSMSLAAGPDDFTGKRVAVIAFEPRQQPIPPEELASILPLKMGEPLHLSDVRLAIERLHATGRYSDIAVDAEIRDGEVILRFLTKSHWFIGRVSVTGVPAPPRPGELAVATKLDLGLRFLDEDTATVVERIQDSLRSNGFFSSAVQPRFQHDPRTHQVNIEFVVDSGKRDRFTTPAVTGSPQRPVEKIVDAAGWKGWFGWKSVTGARVQSGLEDIRKSYQKRDYLMAHVVLDRLQHDEETRRTTPVLDIEAGPVVVVETMGAELGRGRLKRLVPVFEERSVDQDLLVEGARNIREYFQGQGYFNAKATFSSESVDKERQRILYTIDRGERQKLVHIGVQGNRYFDERTIRERMLVTPASMQIRRGRYGESMLRRDRDAIVELYRTNGFRDVKVVTRVVGEYQGSSGDVAVFVEIDEGNQWFVNSLSLQGVRPEDEAVLRPTLQSAPGQPFSEANVATDRENILAYYFNGGYPSATFEWNFEPGSKANMVDLRFVVAEGSRQFVREVLVNGFQSTRPQLINRQILLNPGEPLSQARMLETQRRLYDLGIFSQVDMAIQNPDGEEQNKYILYQLEESRKYSVSGGLGAEIARIGGSRTSLKSPAGEAGFSPRVSFDFSRLNLLGRAHTVSLRTRVSNLQRRALVTYVAPQFRGTESLDLSFTALFDDSRDIRTFSSRRWEGSVQIGQKWTRSKTLLYRFAYRRVAVDENTLNIRPELIPLLSQPVRLGIFSIGYVDDRRDNPADSHRGTYNQLDLGVASGYLGSQPDFSRLLARNSTYHPLGEKVVLARTFSFGWLNPLVADRTLSFEDRIPLPERFFAGGSSTLRSFPQNQAGPRDPVTGFPLGGNAMLLFGTEIRFPLFGRNIGGVLFHDAGNVYSTVQKLSFRVSQRNLQDFNYMVHDVGFGVRYRTPIGPIRTDISFSPNSPGFIGCEGTREDLIFGECRPTQQRISRFQFHFSLGQTF